MEKRLLNECPTGISEEDDENFPVEDPFNDGRPTGRTIGENSTDEKENESGWDSDPEGDCQAVFEWVLGFRWR